MERLRKLHYYLYGYNLGVIKYKSIQTLHERITSKGKLIEKLSSEK